VDVFGATSTTEDVLSRNLSLLLEFFRRPIAQCRVQTQPIVILLDELFDVYTTTFRSRHSRSVLPPSPSYSGARISFCTNPTRFRLGTPNTVL
jgi:hypothetical protein